MGAERPVDTTNAATAAAASENPLVALVALGQSIWLDYITRDLVRGGELRRLIEQDGLRGMTSNPTIFQKAIAGGSAYDAQIEALLGESTQAGAIFEALAVQDIQDACDLFRPLYDRTDAADGYVSIEVSPHVAHDTAGTLTEARRLWQTVDRPNVMIKVPDDQGARYRGRSAGGGATAWRGGQCQYHVALRPRAPRAGDVGLHRGTGAACDRRTTH
ncbi:MAG: hypothetical protein HGA19_10920 [Oscillochloris sp.]|nr:hypothetical protein [Oscillochloris sp.]